MIDPGSMTIWWGRLESPGFDSPVVFDPTLPGMPTGQIYLYTAVRDAIVPYDWNTVQKFLRDVEQVELKAIKKALGRKWHAVRKEYIKALSNRPPMNPDGK